MVNRGDIELGRADASLGAALESGNASRSDIGFFIESSRVPRGRGGVQRLTIVSETPIYGSNGLLPIERRDARIHGIGQRIDRVVARRSVRAG